MVQQKIILVAGPTASGKSALAMQLARAHNGAIINTDALQLYRGLPILTAQPGKTDMDAIPHELYGMLDAAIPSSAGHWLKLATTAVQKTLAAGRTPILTGGTGLYFKAWLGELAEIPLIPEEARAHAQKLYDDLGEEAFRIELAKLDPISASKLARNDRQRQVRAYEVAHHTGKPLDYWQTKGKPPVSNAFEFEAHCLLPEREALYAACDKRFSEMLKQGAIDEVINFMKRGLDPELPAMKTLGLREIAAYTKGEMTLEDMTLKAQQMTRNYAKRQMTWFRNQWPF